jgi:hypothetical protein
LPAPAPILFFNVKFVRAYANEGAAYYSSIMDSRFLELKERHGKS